MCYGWLRLQLLERRLLTPAEMPREPSRRATVDDRPPALHGTADAEASGSVLQGRAPPLNQVPGPADLASDLGMLRLLSKAKELSDILQFLGRLLVSFPMAGSRDRLPPSRSRRPVEADCRSTGSSAQAGRVDLNLTAASIACAGFRTSARTRLRRRQSPFKISASLNLSTRETCARGGHRKGSPQLQQSGSANGGAANMSPPVETARADIWMAVLELWTMAGPDGRPCPH